MKNNKRDWVAVGFSVLLHIILLTGLGRMLPCGESAPLSMLEFELISTVQAAGYHSYATETPALPSPPANAEPLKIKQPLEPDKKPVEKVNPSSTKNTTANTAATDGDIFVAQPAQDQAVQNHMAQTTGDSDNLGTSDNLGISDNLGDSISSGGSGGNSAKAASGKSLKPPQLLHKVEPAYPESARRQNLEGRVIIRLEVDKNGAVTQAIVEQSSGQQSLDSAVLAAVKKWRFIPAKDTAGAPMRSVTTVPVVFKLN